MISGRVHKFGDDVDTDVIIPGQYLDNPSVEFLAKHAMEGIEPEFNSSVSEGDIIVAGRHFGIGSSREQAPIALKACGINIIVAESFARIFYRNAINLGMLPLICPGCSSKLSEGDNIEIDLGKSRIRVHANPSIDLGIEPLSPTVNRIFEAGGMVELLRKEIRHRS